MGTNYRLQVNQSCIFPFNSSAHFLFSEVESFFDKLKENFQAPLIRILCAALIATVVLAIFGFADWLEGIGIAVAVLAATLVATYSEWKNEASFQKLQYEASLVKCNVFR